LSISTVHFYLFWFPNRKKYFSFSAASLDFTLCFFKITFLHNFCGYETLRYMENILDQVYLFHCKYLNIICFIIYKYTNLQISLFLSSIILFFVMHTQNTSSRSVINWQHKEFILISSNFSISLVIYYRGIFSCIVALDSFIHMHAKFTFALSDFSINTIAYYAITVSLLVLLGRLFLSYFRGNY